VRIKIFSLFISVLLVFTSFLPFAADGAEEVDRALFLNLLGEWHLLEKEDNIDSGTYVYVISPNEEGNYPVLSLKEDRSYSLTFFKNKKVDYKALPESGYYELLSENALRFFPDKGDSYIVEYKFLAGIFLLITDQSSTYIFSKVKREDLNYF